MPIRSACSDPRKRRDFPFPRSLFAGMLCLAGTAAHADTYIVGTPVGSGQCTHANVQAAVTAAAAHPGADVIRITRTQNWTAQQISIDSDQDLDILGGFPACTAAVADGTRTILDGSGGDPRPVFAIRGSGIVRLRDLTITGGDQDGDDNGGGIYYEGGGKLDIAETLITANTAYDGGGIYAVGTTDQSELVLGANVIVSFNIAHKSGGGVVAKSLEMSLRGPGSSLMFNEAQGVNGGGNGGGLTVVSDRFKSYAYVSSNGVGGIGAIYANSAVNGGGIAVLGGEESGHEAVAEVFSTTGDADVLVNGNTASSKGGGIYLHSDADQGSGNAVAYAVLRNATLDDNSASDGAAVYLDYDVGSALGYDVGSLVSFGPADGFPPALISPDAAPCPFGRPCGFITNNATTVPTAGAVIRVPSRSQLDANRVALQDNIAGRLIYATDSGDATPTLVLRNALMTGNATAQELIRQAGDGSTYMDHVTMADNDLGTGYVLHLEDDLRVTRSLVSQPGLATFQSAPPTGAVSLVVTNDPDLAGANTYAAARFVDSERGDYNLQAGSVAVDYAPAQDGDDGDINSHTRNLDLPGIPNQAGPGDAGAFEREHFDALVRNADFDADLHLWDAIGSAQWDGTQNVTGGTGSGSLKATLAIDDTRLAVRTQCVHIPGPGTYVLNGWGRASHGSPFHNQARLAWELRRNGSVFGCTDGPPDATGEFVIADDTTWVKPAVGGTIEVTDADWGNNTSLTIYAVGINGNPIALAPRPAPAHADGGGPNLWFDGITMERAVDDVIFRSGFDVP